MAIFIETIQWVQDVYRLATTDPVLGGNEKAPSNKGLSAVVDRTAYLKSELEKLQEALANIHPIGEVQMLAGPAYNAADYDDTGLGRVGTPAENWALCNGLNNTYAMGGVFPVGLGVNTLDYGTPGQTGGAANVQLITAELPRHTHEAGFKITDGGADLPYKAARQSSNKASGANVTTGETGGNQPHENRPPFVVLVYRQRVAN